MKTQGETRETRGASPRHLETLNYIRKPFGRQQEKLQELKYREGRIASSPKDIGHMLEYTYLDMDDSDEEEETSQNTHKDQEEGIPHTPDWSEERQFRHG